MNVNRYPHHWKHQITSTTSMVNHYPNPPNTYHFFELYNTFNNSWCSLCSKINSKFMHTLTNIRCHALKWLLWYLQGTILHGLLIHHNSPLHIHALTDADWVGDKQTYRSTTGYIVYIGSNPIAWISKLQTNLNKIFYWGWISSCFLNNH